MAITGWQWGGWAGHLRVGINIWCDDPGPASTTVRVFVQAAVQIDSSWSFSDSQNMTISGPGGSWGWNWQNTLGPNGIWYSPVVELDNQPVSYSGGPTYTYSAVNSGNYLGVNASATWSLTLPPRPPSPPSAPSYNPVYDTILATSFHASWGQTSNANGASPDMDEFQLATDSAMTAIIFDQTVAGRSDITVGGLAPGSTHWGRSRQHNVAGWGAWSGVTAVTQDPYQLAAPGVTVGPTSAAVTWGDPPTSDTPTGYQVQAATDADFTNVTQTVTGASWAKTATAHGLVPGTNYYFRVRANTASGWGAWSTGTVAKTLSGAKVAYQGAWLDAVAFIRINGAWKQAVVLKHDAGVWKN